MDGADPTWQSHRYWLALNRVAGIGIAHVERLRRRFDSVAAIFETSRVELEQSGISRQLVDQILAPDWQRVDADCAWLQQPGHALITCADAGYPALLREIPDPPLMLFVDGDAGVLAGPMIGIVGSRNPSPVGRELAAGFARQLARMGCVVASGLATGIDGAAHEGALDGPGLTLAVSGCGPDQVYPRRHRSLAGRIRTRGALVSEYSPGMPPLAGNFPRRNRIISGLSLGVLVVEAALRSGSLITARLAAEQGREVFAVPGSIRNPLARGCHALIRQGAKLVEDVQDIVEELGPLLNVTPAAQAVAGTGPGQHDRPLDPDGRLLMDCMGDAPVSVDLLVQRSGLTVDAVSSMLLLLELRGLVAAQPGGVYSRLR